MRPEINLINTVWITPLCAPRRGIHKPISPVMKMPTDNF
jgi:hypothetical protein